MTARNNPGRSCVITGSTDEEDVPMTQSTIRPLVDTERLRTSIRDEYSAVATEPSRGFHFHTGRPLLQRLGYDDTMLEGIPEEALASAAGTGNPFALGEILAGERIVDCGSGSGVDSMVAARLVGSDGRVIGVDMTPEMLTTARRASTAAGLDNVEFRDGLLESLPVEDGWADVIISNGVLNLVPDKAAALGEMARVLRPGGRLQIADIVLGRAVSEDSKHDVSLWTGCIAGGLLADELGEAVRDAGFSDVEVIVGADVFAGAPQHSNAAEFGTRGAGIRARRPGPGSAG
jgi:arsenite methyltransferase